MTEEYHKALRVKYVSARSSPPNLTHNLCKHGDNPKDSTLATETATPLANSSSALVPLNNRHRNVVPLAIYLANAPLLVCQIKQILLYKFYSLIFE